jgi:DHA1 family tetracycline resistance protein-like MFS transporter
MTTNSQSRFSAAVPFILITVMLDMLGLGIIIPVLPKLVEGFTGSPSTAGYWMGAFGALWGLMQFVFSPIQGGLSDAHGRRPVILGSNIGMGLDYFLMAFAPNIWVLLLGRAISGATSASISTAYAYISDVTKPEDRAKYFGMMGASFGIGFVIGPAIGGIVGDIDHRLPFVVAGCLSLANALYGFFVLPESLTLDKRKPFSFKTSNPLGAFGFLSRTPQLLRLALINLTLMFSHHVLPVVFVLYAGFRYGWGPKEVGLSLGVVGICSAVVQAFLTGVVVKAVGEKTAMLIGLTCGIFGFIGYGLAPTGVLMLCVIPLMSLWGFATPAGQALMSLQVAPSENGTLQGSVMGLSSMAGILAPVVFGSVFALATHQGLPTALSGAPFFLAACIIGLAAFLALGVKPRGVVMAEKATVPESVA